MDDNEKIEQEARLENEAIEIMQTLAEEFGFTEKELSNLVEAVVHGR